MIDYSVVLDENERQRMIADGYLPEVIDYHARERYEQMRADFSRKNAILSRYYEPTPYFEFVADVFPDLEKLMVVTGETTYSEMGIDELMEYQSCRSNVYVAPASFIHGCYSGSTCQDLYAFVVDIDRIHPDTLDAIIENGNLGNLTPMPTYIVNSGSGVHFYYVFKEPVPYYYKNRDLLKSMYRVLCSITQRNILAKTDWHAITQPFRLPGSQTKLEQVVTGWKCGEKWHVRALAKRLGIDAEEIDLLKRPLLSQSEYKEELARRESLSEGLNPDDVKPKKKKRRKEWKSSLEGKTGFYLSCLQRCYEETVEGTRYRSLMALTVVARKVGYPKDQLELDLLELLEHYNQIGRRMTQSEVKKALRMYNEKALQTKSETLEIWFGWNFYRDEQRRREKQKTKGKTKTREDVWKIARNTRDILYPDGLWRNKSGAPTAEHKVQQYRYENPEGKPKDCITATGLSKNTVYKWWNSKPQPALEPERKPAYYRYTPTGIEPVYLEEE